jgi:hypothetical protein
MPEVMNAMAKLRYTVNGTEFVCTLRTGIHKATMTPPIMNATPITARAMPIDTLFSVKNPQVPLLKPALFESIFQQLELNVPGQVVIL